MLRQKITPRTAAIATLLVLAAIQLIYWRLLVYREPGRGRGGGGGGPMGASVRTAQGRQDVTVDTLAGDRPGYADGAGWQARFAGPNALALAPDGSLLVTDSRNHRLRQVTPLGKVSTLAGGGDPGSAGGQAEGPAAVARFRFPSGVAAAPDGTIYIADTGNHRLCRLRDGQVTLLAGGAEGQADGGGPTARFRFPAALALDDGGFLWVADQGNRAVRRVDPSGNVTTPAAPPTSVAAALGDVGAAPPGRPFLACPEGRGLPEPSGFTLGRRSPGIAAPGAIAQGPPPLRLFADSDYSVVLAEREGEPPLLIAGTRVGETPQVGVTDGEGHRAYFAVPCAAGLAADGTGYVVDYEGNRIRRLRLPNWLTQGRSAPTRQTGGGGRQRRGG
jgi:hypothetical protein